MVTLQNAICPICEEEISIYAEFVEGALIKCLSCGSDLKATHVKGVLRLSCEPKVQKQ